MTQSLWINVINGRRLDQHELRESRERAHRAYEANRHLFEDESEVLRALGIMPILEAIRLDLVGPHLLTNAA